MINSSATGTVTGFNEVGGLVGATGLAAAIQNSHATGDVSGNNQVGGLVGNLDPSHVVTNSSASGDVTGRWDVGGLVGYSSGDITLSYATGAVSGEDRVGGLVGYSSGDIAFSSAKGEVTSTAVNAVDDGVHGELAPGGANGIGGLVGYNTGNITSSFTGEADTDLPIPSGAVTGLKNVGGLVGFSSGNITNSRATGDVNQSWSCIMGEAYAPCFEYIGGLVGKSEGDITNSWASGNVGGQDYVGGLVGQLDGDVTNSYAAGYVSGDRYVGGLVGRSTGVITNGETYADKSLELDYVSGSEFVGGLVGYSEGNVIDSVSRVPVSGGRYVGGLVGKSEGNVTNSVAEGEVRGESSEVGGLVGYSVGDITNSSATGDVTGAGIAGPTDYIGGLVGYLEGVIKNSFATGSVTGRDNVGGLVGSLFQGLPWSNEYSDLSTLRSSRPTPNIGEINLVQGDFYTWDGDDWRKIFSISGSYASGNVIGQDYIGGLVGRAGESTTIDSSFARGNVSGDDEVGGLIGLLNDGASVTHSYATGDVIGNDDVGGLVGLLNDGASVTHSYATGDVTGNLTEGDGGDVGGLVGIVYGIISNSHATGDVSGIYDVGGLVGDLNSDGVIRNSYATGNVTATGFDGDWTNGWGGLVGEFSGIIENSYATGNVLADYHAGSLVGFILYDSGATINNSFATGVVSRGSRSVAFSPEERCIESCDTYEPVQVPVNFVEWNSAFGGFVGCQSSETNGDGVINVSCSVEELTQSTPAAPPILSVVNTAGTAGAPAFEIIACKNNGLPLLSELSASYANTCVAPVTTNRERRIREFIQTTSMTEIAKTLGFVVSPKFPNDASIAFIKSEKELVISKILGLQIAADRVARTFVKTGEALQISYEYEGKDPIELWVKLANGQWLLAGVITFDKDGKAILPPLQFKSAGDYSLVLSKPSADSAKGSAPLNQTGSLLVAVS